MIKVNGWFINYWLLLFINRLYCIELNAYYLVYY